jgi:hypothetical protein
MRDGEVARPGGASSPSLFTEGRSCVTSLPQGALGWWGPGGGACCESQTGQKGCQGARGGCVRCWQGSGWVGPLV